MPGPLREQEPLSSPDATLNWDVVDGLRGEISEPIQTISHKPGSDGELVNIRIAIEGPGLFGLTDWKDNKEWSGITNHVLLSARYAVYFAQKMKEAGFLTNPQRVLNGMLVSHPGRRQWDEAGWYPEVVADASAKRSISNETLGIQLIHDHVIFGKIPFNAFELVVALGHNVEGFSVDPAIYTSWDFKVAIYADHRTTQKYEPLNTRMADFFLGNFFKKDQITDELPQKAYQTFGDLIERQKNYHFDKTQPVSLEEADSIAQNLGANPSSERVATRKEFMQLVLGDADTEAALVQAGIDTNNINDLTVPGPKWEDDFRKEYVRAAQYNIAKEVYSAIAGNTSDVAIFAGLNEKFSLDSWWGQYARKIFYELYDNNEEIQKHYGEPEFQPMDSLLKNHFKRA